MAMITPDKWRDFWKYYVGGVKQLEGIDALYEAMPKSLLEDDTTWIDLFRTPDPIKESSGVMPIDAVELICEFEGFRPNVYNDGIGVPTIGYGSTFYLDGRRVQWTDPAISEPVARRMMEDIAEEQFWQPLTTTIPFWDEMSRGQKGCLLSFAYNCGLFYGAPGFTTISACLKDKAWDEVPGALMLYVNPGSPVEVGLKRRRRAEGELWKK
jgi:GH24 family phage-related lysozyme (muramidase)